MQGVASAPVSSLFILGGSSWRWAHAGEETHAEGMTEREWGLSTRCTTLAGNSGCTVTAEAAHDVKVGKKRGRRGREGEREVDCLQLRRLAAYPAKSLQRNFSLGRDRMLHNKTISIRISRKLILLLLQNDADRPCPLRQARLELAESHPYCDPPPACCLSISKYSLACSPSSSNLVMAALGELPTLAAVRTTVSDDMASKSRTVRSSRGSRGELMPEEEEEDEAARGGEAETERERDRARGEFGRGGEEVGRDLVDESAGLRVVVSWWPVKLIVLRHSPCSPLLAFFLRFLAEPSSDDDTEATERDRLVALSSRPVGLLALLLLEVLETIST